MSCAKEYIGGGEQCLKGTGVLCTASTSQEECRSLPAGIKFSKQYFSRFSTRSPCTSPLHKG